MKYRSVDDLLDSKEETGRETVRPNITVGAAAWDNFRFALEYENLNRSTHIYPGAVVEVLMGEFVEKVKARTLKIEGSLNGFTMFMADKIVAKQAAEEKRRKKTKVEGLLSDRFKEDKGDTLNYEGKTVKRKRTTNED